MTKDMGGCRGHELSVPITTKKNLDSFTALVVPGDKHLQSLQS
jgi:hypothetical protein